MKDNPSVLTSLLLMASMASSLAGYGLQSRPAAKPYLEMPDRADRPIPQLLSRTGAFRKVQSLSPAEALIPYELNLAFWSDGAHKTRWVSIPNEHSSGPQVVNFSPTGEWGFPQGTVFVKHFDLTLDETHPEQRRRLETRFLICDSTGSVYGVTYKWRVDNSDADLLTTNLTELIPIKTAAGIRTQVWYYPNPQDCRVCHTDLAGGVLGLKTRQMNCEFSYPSGVVDNQLRSWNHVGLFRPAIMDSDIPGLPRLAKSNETTRSLEDRARSYLDANCAHCHRPGGTVASFDARYDTPLRKQNLIGGQVLIDQGVDKAVAIAPNDPWRSMVLMRLASVDAIRMPPLAHLAPDEQGIALLREWIKTMPGPPVLAPPEISPHGGKFNTSVTVTLQHPEPGAAIHYTLDGSAPALSDPVYQEPIKLEGPTIVRARAYKHDFTRSITVQEVFTNE